MSVSIDITDAAVSAALDLLAARAGNVGPVLGAAGEDIVARIKARFPAAADPAGLPWKPNAPATILAYVVARGGLTKTGRISKKGVALAMTKRPLQGETGQLAAQNHYAVTNTPDGAVLTVANTMIYAAIQHFGGKAGRGKKTTIPARPFFPLLPSGDLYPSEQALIVRALSDYIAGAAR